MKKNFFVFFLMGISVILYAQANWFKAQSDSATIKSVTATSELVEAQYDGKYLYPPVNIVDGDFSSTWCEADQSGPGIGEAITIELEEPVTFDELQIVNGFVYKDYYHKNNRVKSFLLTQTAKEHFQQKEYMLQDNVQDWQSVKFDLEQTAQTLTIEIRDVYRGTTYNDTCLDDIRLLYKGKVIPFKNVATIKKAQEENSKLMLTTNAEEFRKQFLSLPSIKDGDSLTERVLYLTTEKQQENNSLAIRIIGNEIDDIHSCTVTSKKDVLVSWLDDVDNNSFYKRQVQEIRSDINANNYKTFIFGIVPVEWRYSRRIKYEIGNSRIIGTRNVDYVEVKTVTLLKIDGDAVFVNGVKYTVLEPEGVYNACMQEETW